MTKTFVLDTNVLLHDPNAIFKFEEHNIVIPIYVIEEIDDFKKELSELGRNAREVSRHLDNLRERGSLNKGVHLREGGILYIRVSNRTLPDGMRPDRDMDSRILAVAFDEHENDTNAVLVTKDINLRIRADALGLATEDYENDRVVSNDLYPEVTEIMVSTEEIDELYKGSLIVENLTLFSNQCLMLVDETRRQHTALARHVDGKLFPVSRENVKIWGLSPRNREQQFALELLLDDRIKLVTLAGRAGTGKTVMAIAAGLQKVVEEKAYSKVIVSRPIFPLGRDIGYLPGTIEEKLNPWMQPIFDNIDFLMNFDEKSKKSGRNHRELFDLGLIQVEPLTYIRGRSIPNQFMIVDESQNLTPHEIKTIVSRAGEGTKIVLTGDPHQIDNPYIDATNNGLTTLINRFRDQKISGHVTLLKGERSELAEIASQML